MSKIFLIELNEINFDFVRHYIGENKLPNLAALIDRHGVSLTTSESRYDEIEPWIQWVSAHTGCSYADHGVFRLGDAVGRDLHQIWEHLEQKGLRVGAVSPMNAENRTTDAAFFVADPWTPTQITGSALLTRFYGAVRQAVNDNAQSRIKPSSVFWLLLGALRYVQPRNLWRLFRYVRSSWCKPWNRALILDMLLADIFLFESRRKRPDFASLFLNAGAHIQHHYMFNSRAYAGDARNPPWYVAPSEDPVLEIYSLYDQIIGDMIRNFPHHRLLIATGLHQVPHPSTTFYWRLKDHADFLTRAGIAFEKVEPRMSRDFLVVLATAEQASVAEQILASMRVDDGKALFEIDNRGRDLFVTLTYSEDVSANMHVIQENRDLGHLRRELAFVAIKNGMHDSEGYLIDMGETRDTEDGRTTALADLPHRICEGFGLTWEKPSARVGVGRSGFPRCLSR